MLAALLMLAACRGYSLIRFAPVRALPAVLLTDPAAVLPMINDFFREEMVSFFKLARAGSRA